MRFRTDETGAISEFSEKLKKFDHEIDSKKLDPATINSGFEGMRFEDGLLVHSHGAPVVFIDEDPVA